MNAMRVRCDLSPLKQQRWQEYAVRFLFGGLITAFNGLIGRKFGPLVGGLFLAFPAILPATLTVVEKHQKQRKQRAGFDGTKRARCAASLESRSAAMGSIGLLAFATVAWRLLPEQAPGLVLVAALLAWLGLSLVLWRGRRMIVHAMITGKRQVPQSRP